MTFLATPVFCRAFSTVFSLLPDSHCASRVSTAGLLSIYLPPRPPRPPSMAHFTSLVCAYHTLAPRPPVHRFVILSNCLTESWASFNQIAFCSAFATSISLFTERNHGIASSRYLEAFIHTLCSHSFCAESANAPPLVNMPIFPNNALALSNSTALGFLLFINHTSSSTISLFQAVGIISPFFVTFAKFFNTSPIHCCNSRTWGALFILALANNEDFCFAEFFIISVSCVWICFLFQAIHLFNNHWGALSIFTTHSSERRDNLSEAFNSADGVASHLEMRDSGSDLVIKFFTLLNHAPATGNTPHNTVHNHTSPWLATSNHNHSVAPLITFETKGAFSAIFTTLGNMLATFIAHHPKSVPPITSPANSPPFVYPLSGLAPIFLCIIFPTSSPDCWNSVPHSLKGCHGSSTLPTLETNFPTLPICFGTEPINQPNISFCCFSLSAIFSLYQLASNASRLFVGRVFCAWACSFLIFSISMICSGENQALIALLNCSGVRGTYPVVFFFTGSFASFTCAGFTTGEVMGFGNVHALRLSTAHCIQPENEEGSW